MELEPQQKLAKMESIISKTEIHVANFVDAFRVIRDEKLYEAAGYNNFAAYCAERWKKSVRSVHLALQLDDVKKDVVQRVAVQSDQQTQALAEGASEKTIAALAPVAPEKRVAVLRAAAEETGGKPTGAAVKRAAARLAHKKSKPEPEPEQPRAFSAFTDKPVDTSAYTSPRAEAPTPAASFGGDADEPEADAELPEVVDAASAARRLELVYERDKAWFNEVDGKGMPLRYPRAILDRLIAGLHE